MGRVPVFIWDDTPWIPYSGTQMSVEMYGLQSGLHKFTTQHIPVYSEENYADSPHKKVKTVEVEVSLASLVKEMEKLKQDKEAMQTMNDALKEARYHFTYPGVVHAIEKFITDPFDLQVRIYIYIVRVRVFSPSN